MIIKITTVSLLIYLANARPHYAQDEPPKKTFNGYDHPKMSEPFLSLFGIPLVEGRTLPKPIKETEPQLQEQLDPAKISEHEIGIQANLLTSRDTELPSGVGQLISNEIKDQLIESTQSDKSPPEEQDKEEIIPDINEIIPTTTGVAKLPMHVPPHVLDPRLIAFDEVEGFDHEKLSIGDTAKHTAVPELPTVYEDMPHIEEIVGVALPHIEIIQSDVSDVHLPVQDTLPKLEMVPSAVQPPPDELNLIVEDIQLEEATAGLDIQLMTDVKTPPIEHIAISEDIHPILLPDFINMIAEEVIPVNGAVPVEVVKIAPEVIEPILELSIPVEDVRVEGTKDISETETPILEEIIPPKEIVLVEEGIPPLLEEVSPFVDSISMTEIATPLDEVIHSLEVPKDAVSPISEMLETPLEEIQPPVQEVQTIIKQGGPIVEEVDPIIEHPISLPGVGGGGIEKIERPVQDIQAVVKKVPHVVEEVDPIIEHPISVPGIDEVAIEKMPPPIQEIQTIVKQDLHILEVDPILELPISIPVVDKLPTFRILEPISTVDDPAGVILNVPMPLFNSYLPPPL